MLRLILAVAAVVVLVVAMLLFDASDPRTRGDRAGGAEPDADASASATPRDSAPERPRNRWAMGGTRRESSGESTAARLVGRVVDENGAPIPDAHVSIAENLDPFQLDDVFTAADGRFAIPCKPEVPSKATFTVQHPQYSTMDAVEHETGPDLTLVLKSGLRIHGRARFADGTPAVGLEIDAGASPVRSNERGEFILGGFEPGLVVVECEGVSRAYEFEAGSSNIEFVLDQSIVRVSATNAAGKPLVTASWRGKIGPHVFAGELDARGRKSIATFPGELGWLVVHAPGYLPERFAVVTRTEEARLHDFNAVMRPVPDTRLAVRVLGSAAKTTATLMWLDDDVPLRIDRLDLENGSGVVEGLPIGTLHLRVWTESPEVFAERRVAIRRGAGNETEFSLPRAARLRVRWECPGRGWALGVETLGGRRLKLYLQDTTGDGDYVASSPIALGRYRLVELNGLKVEREKVIELSAPGPTAIDWME